MRDHTALKEMFGATDPFNFALHTQTGEVLNLTECSMVGFSFDVVTKIRTYLVEGSAPNGQRLRVTVPIQEH
jgi:hypothetical protein